MISLFNLILICNLGWLQNFELYGGLFCTLKLQSVCVYVLIANKLLAILHTYSYAKYWCLLLLFDNKAAIYGPVQPRQYTVATESATVSYKVV